MHTKLRVIDTLKIASPCDAKWEDMAGNDRVRMCGLCDKNVYNLTEMDDHDILALIQKTQGTFCGQLFQREDHTIIAENCPVGLARVQESAKKAWQWSRTLTRSMCALLSGIFLSCDGAYFDEDTQTLVEGVEQTESEHTLDGIEILEDVEAKPREMRRGMIRIPRDFDFPDLNPRKDLPESED